MEYAYSDFGATRQAGKTANGIRVVVYHIPDRPIAMTAAFNAGRRYDPPGLECQAHVLEHMIVAGTQDMPSKDKIAAYIEGLGGSIAARTELSMLLLKLTMGHVSDFGAAVYLLDQLLVHSLYDETTFVKEIESVRQELAAVQANPSRHVERLFIEQLFGNTRLSSKTMDNHTAINRVTIDDVRRWGYLRLRGNNLVIVLAGGITLKEAIAELDRGLSLEPGLMPLMKPRPIKYHAPEVRLVAQEYASSSQVQLTYGFPGYRAGHPDNPALDVLTTLIGGGRAGTLSRLLRYEAGLVYSVRAENSSEIGCGAWQITTGTKAVNLARALELINNELQRAIDGITAEELALAKATLINSARVRFDAIPAFLEPHVLPDLYGLPSTTRIPGWLTAVGAVTLDDVTRVAQEIFRPGTSVLTLCGAQAAVDESALF